MSQISYDKALAYAKAEYNRGFIEGQKAMREKAFNLCEAIMDAHIESNDLPQDAIRNLPIEGEHDEQA